MENKDGECEDIQEIVQQIAEEINQERGTTGPVFLSDIINYTTRHQDRYSKYAEIVRHCLESLKNGEFQV
mgnify:CR=1 FL=1